jgi:hypothetical protein
MDSSTKVFLIFCFAVFFFSGCQKNEEPTRIRQGPGGAEARQKLVPDKNAQEIGIVIQSLREMDALVRDIWFVIANKENRDLPSPANALTVILRSLLVDYNDNGQKKTKNLKPARCESGRPLLEWREKIDPQAKTQFSAYQLFFVSCSGAKRFKEPMAAWVSDGQGRVKLRLNPEQLNREPLNGLGKLTHHTEDVFCDLAVDLQKKQLQAFRCQNLSQDWRGMNEVKASKAYKFVDLDFDWQRENKLKGRYLILDYSSAVPKADAFDFNDDLEKKILTLAKEQLSDSEKATLPFPLINEETAPVPQAPATRPPTGPSSAPDSAALDSVNSSGVSGSMTPATTAQPPKSETGSLRADDGRSQQPTDKESAQGSEGDSAEEDSAPAREDLPIEIVT